MSCDRKRNEVEPVPSIAAQREERRLDEMERGGEDTSQRPQHNNM